MYVDSRDRVVLLLRVSGVAVIDCFKLCGFYSVIPA